MNLRPGMHGTECLCDVTSDERGASIEERRLEKSAEPTRDASQKTSDSPPGNEDYRDPKPEDSGSSTPDDSLRPYDYNDEEEEDNTETEIPEALLPMAIILKDWAIGLPNEEFEHRQMVQVNTDSDLVSLMAAVCRSCVKPVILVQANRTTHSLLQPLLIRKAAAADLRANNDGDVAAQTVLCWAAVHNGRTLAYDLIAQILYQNLPTLREDSPT
ncbi:hypothetical protein EDC01DRAFT_777519 [Geopyxis carbonaria]|nr:hypothetical protein EDC01DRAFT_777519 [Geopyxis carbonaria]